MPSNRQFYKTICMVVVLSEEPIQTTDLAEIARQGLIGAYSVAVSDSEITVLDGVAAARELAPSIPTRRSWARRRRRGSERRAAPGKTRPPHRRRTQCSNRPRSPSRLCLMTNGSR